MKRPRYMALGGPTVTPTIVLRSSPYAREKFRQFPAPTGGGMSSGGSGGGLPTSGGGMSSGGSGGGLTTAGGGGSVSQPRIEQGHPRPLVKPPAQTPTTTPGTSTSGSVVGGSDSGSTVYGSGAGTVVNTVVTMPMPSSTISAPRAPRSSLPFVDDLNLDMTPGLVAQFEAMSTTKKVALAAAVAGGLYLLLGRKR